MYCIMYYLIETHKTKKKNQKIKDGWASQSLCYLSDQKLETSSETLYSEKWYTRFEKFFFLSHKKGAA